MASDTNKAKQRQSSRSKEYYKNLAGKLDLKRKRKKIRGDARAKRRVEANPNSPYAKRRRRFARIKTLRSEYRSGERQRPRPPAPRKPTQEEEMQHQLAVASGHSATKRSANGNRHRKTAPRKGPRPARDED